MKVRQRDANVPEVDMTPMIDIVFQLIAFFMVITNFENTRADERVKLPTDRIAKPADAPREKELVLNVGYERTRDGQFDRDAPILFYGDGTQYALGEITPVLQKEARYFKDEGTKLEEVAVVIRADARLPSGQVQQLISRSQTEGFTLFKVKAQQPE